MSVLATALYRVQVNDVAQFRKSLDRQSTRRISIPGRRGRILDRFGTDIWMRPLDDEHFSAQVVVTVSPQFFGWVTALGKGLEITGPEQIREQYREYMEQILHAYEEPGQKHETDD